MKLRDYLDLKGINDSDAAKSLDITRQYLNEIKNGRPAGRNLGRKIVNWTKGAVTLEEILFPDAA